MQNHNNFNRIAPIYDALCQLVFGQKLRMAQTEALKFIPPGSTLLIAGGGTGWLLEETGKIHPSGLTITYIDKSSKMIQLSKKREVFSNAVTFINTPIENTVLPNRNYDVIITPFFLDCFAQSTFQSVFEKLDNSLTANGLWLNIDFYLSAQSKYGQKLLVKLMYFFFRLTCSIEAKKLPPTERCFSTYETVESKLSCKGFIRMQILKKRSAAEV